MLLFYSSGIFFFLPPVICYMCAATSDQVNESHLDFGHSRDLTLCSRHLYPLHGMQTGPFQLSVLRDLDSCTSRYHHTGR